MQTLLKLLTHEGTVFKGTLVISGVDVSSYELDLGSRQLVAAAERCWERPRLGRVPGRRKAPDISGKYLLTAQLHDSSTAPRPYQVGRSQIAEFSPSGWNQTFTRSSSRSMSPLPTQTIPILPSPRRPPFHIVRAPAHQLHQGIRPITQTDSRGSDHPGRPPRLCGLSAKARLARSGSLRCRTARSTTTWATCLSASRSSIPAPSHAHGAISTRPPWC